MELVIAVVAMEEEVVHVTVNSDETQSKFYYDLYLAQELVDTKIVLSDGCLEAHGIILAGRSEIIYKMLKEQTKPQGTLDFKEFKTNIMRLIIELCYRGEIKYNRTIDAEIFQVIDHLKIDVEKDCEKWKPPPEEQEDSVIEVPLPERSIIEVLDDSAGDPDSSIDFLSLEGNRGTSETPRHDSSKPDLDDTVVYPNTTIDVLSLEGNGGTLETPRHDLSKPDVNNTQDDSNKSMDFLLLEGNQEILQPPSSQSSDETKIEDDSRDDNPGMCVRNPFAPKIIKEETVAGSTKPSNSLEPLPSTCLKLDPSWLTTKENNTFPLNYCLICKKRKNRLHLHIERCHKQPTEFYRKCRKCHTGFFYKIFYLEHKKRCK